MPPSNTVINLDTSNAPAELTLWPDFHSGVAAGLRVAPAFETSTFNAYDTELATASNDKKGSVGDESNDSSSGSGNDSSSGNGNGNSNSNMQFSNSNFIIIANI